MADEDRWRIKLTMAMKIDDGNVYENSCNFRTISIPKKLRSEITYAMCAHRLHYF